VPALSFFGELKRRNVIRVAAAYLVVGWVVIEVASTVAPNLNLPEWTARMVTLLVMLGFPLALVLAWIFEVTPEGMHVTEGRTGSKRFYGIVALITALALGWYLWPAAPTEQLPTQAASNPAASQPAAANTAPAPAEPSATAAPLPQARAGKSIAVLPFVNMSADAENEYFADGISEELLNVLVKVEDIGVASRTSSFAYKGRELGAAVIARELNVNHILEGSVRKAGNRVRITAQLIDAAEDRHLWSETYDRELTDIFAIQDEIANAIVAALRGTLGAGEAQRAVTVRGDTNNMDAYQRYLKARELFLSRTAIDESVRLFQEVVAMDPEFARGWEGLAAASAIIIDWAATYPDIDPDQMSARALEAAERALVLDPQLAMPWAVRALLMNYTLPIPFAESLVLFDKALSADPAQASVYLWRAIVWINLGFLERAMHDVDACLAIDPAYGNCLRWKAVTAAFIGDDALAIALYERGVATGFIVNRADTLIERLVARGDRLAAMLLLAQLEMPPELQQAIIGAIEQDAPPARLAELLERHPRFDVPTWHLALRAYDRAAAWEGRITTLVSYWDPAHAGFRNSPAFRRILEYLGVPAYWREHGYPPLCRPVGAGDYECVQ
jgi:adenylate cyclase